MIRNALHAIKKVWPNLLLAICAALSFGLMIFMLREAIHALGSLGHFQDVYDGPPLFFLLFSLILGWISVWLVEHRLSIAGYGCLTVAGPCILASLLGGYVLALCFGTEHTTELAFLIGFSVLTAVVTAAFRCYYYNPEGG